MRTWEKSVGSREPKKVPLDGIVVRFSNGNIYNCLHFHIQSARASRRLAWHSDTVSTCKQQAIWIKTVRHNTNIERFQCFARRAKLTPWGSSRESLVRFADKNGFYQASQNNHFGSTPHLFKKISEILITEQYAQYDNRLCHVPN